MALSVKSLNGDTSLLLTFSPSIAPRSSSGLFPGSFTILVNPRLVGPSTILNSKFFISEQKATPCITNLRQLVPEPDLIVISQHKPDHCHEETLKQLSQGSEAMILATSPAAKKIRSWKHFHPERVQSLPRYTQGDKQSIHRFPIPALSQRGSAGEVTIAWIPARHDLTRVHHAIGITYRPPSTVLSQPSIHYTNLPPIPSDSLSSMSSKISISSPLPSPFPFAAREKTLSVIYTPCGIPYSLLHSYAAHHLIAEAALPLTALLHSFNYVENPWWLGGMIPAGCPNGALIASGLCARGWVSAHEGDKKNRGWAARRTSINEVDVRHAKKLLNGDDQEPERNRDTTGVDGGRGDCEIVQLDVGQEWRVER